MADRLAHRAQLEPFSSLDLEAGIAHRCKIACAHQVLFDREALRDRSRGNYRACDRLAYKALELTHDKNLNQVTANLRREGVLVMNEKAPFQLPIRRACELSPQTEEQS